MGNQGTALIAERPLGTETAAASALTSRLAFAGALLMLCLIGVSAYLRLSAAGLGCEPWPDCYVQAAGGATAQQHHPVARLSHRVLASAVGMVVLLIVFASFACRAQRAAHFWIALGLLALTAALAVLGRTTPGTANALVAPANLLGGLALLGSLTWLAADLRPSAARDRRLQLLSLASLGLTAMQAAAGALLSTTHSAAACASLVDCDTAWPAAALNLTHRLLGVILLLVNGALGVALLRSHSRARILAIALIALPLGQIGIGAGMLTSHIALPLALLHNLLAALLLATTIAAVRSTARSRPNPAAQRCSAVAE